MADTNRISQKFAELSLSDEKGLITFITAGDPNLDKTTQLVLILEKAGADIIELGVPYSDPLADGPIIQQASQRALRSGTNLTKIMAMVDAVIVGSALVKTIGETGDTSELDAIIYDMVKKLKRPLRGF